VVAENDLPRVAGDPAQLQHVLLNLISNAIEAMATVEEARRVLGVRCRRHEAGGVAISGGDAGAGIDEANLEQIFDPLFSTKPGGTGLGLAISRSIVAHGGSLRVRRGARGGRRSSWSCRRFRREWAASVSG